MSRGQLLCPVAAIIAPKSTNEFNVVNAKLADGWPISAPARF
jgi:hypothetical protein